MGNYGIRKSVCFNKMGDNLIDAHVVWRSNVESLQSLGSLRQSRQYGLSQIGRMQEVTALGAIARQICGPDGHAEPAS